MTSQFKFRNLAGSPGKSCNLITFRDVQIMVDCTLDFMSILAYLPLSLVQNHRLLELPNWNPPRDKLKEVNLNFKESRLINYEVKECHAGFHCVNSAPEFATFDMDSIDVGVIYVTEPTYHFGRMLMEEVVKLIERTPCPKRAHLWKRIHDQVNLCLPRNHLMNRNPNDWLPIYSSKELASCLSKLKIVSFQQSIDIFGLFDVSAHSSAFCIGSCNWVFKSNHEKVVYMSHTSLLTTHPKPFESHPLQDADVLVLTNLTPSPLINPDTMLGDFCSHTIKTLRNDGNVLVPCYPCGLVYDLIECIAGQLAVANLQNVPIYFISPVADSSLAYSNILSEWLTTNRQSKVFIPDEPFIHSSLINAGKLKHFSSVSDQAFNEAFRSPCIVFTAHPSLRFGDVVHFIQLWGQSSRNLMILTEPDFPCQEIVNPYLPLLMRMLYIPIDTNWNFKQANALLSNELRPAHLILHNNYVTKPPANYPAQIHSFSNTDLMIELSSPNAIEESSTSLVIPGTSLATTDNTGTSNDLVAKCRTTKTTIHPYTFENSVDLCGSKSLYERIKIDPKFADQIIQNEIKPGITFATINGTLVAKDNRYSLQCMDEDLIRKGVKGGGTLPPSHYYYGNLDFQLLLELLSRNGITDASVESAKGSRIIELRSMKAVIHLEESQTHIITADYDSRDKLRDMVTTCLRKF